MIQDIRDVPVPTLGRFYLVPCVALSGRKRPWPVMGSYHADPDIGIPFAHYHTDIRFLPDRALRLYEGTRYPHEWTSEQVSMTYVSIVNIQLVPTLPASDNCGPGTHTLTKEPYLEDRMADSARPSRIPTSVSGYEAEPVYTSMDAKDQEVRGFVLWLPDGVPLKMTDGNIMVYPTLASADQGAKDHFQFRRRGDDGPS